MCCCAAVCTTIFPCLTCLCCFPLRPQRIVSARQQEQAAGTRHTRGALPSGTASTGCVGPHSVGTLLSEKSTETGHSTCFSQTRTDRHTHTEIKSIVTILEDVPLKTKCNFTLLSTVWMCYPVTSLLSGMSLFFLALP